MEQENFLFNPVQVRRYRARAVPACDFLFRWCGAQMATRLADIRRDFPLALQTDPRTPIISPKIGHLVHGGTGPFDLILSPLALHTENDLHGAMMASRRVLAPEGLFLGAVFGTGTLATLRDTLMEAEGSDTPRIYPFPDGAQMTGVLQHAWLREVVVDTARLRVTYPDIFALMHDLRGMGEGNAMTTRTPATRGMFARAQALYPKMPDGRIEAVFEILFLLGWASATGRATTPA